MSKRKLTEVIAYASIEAYALATKNGINARDILATGKKGIVLKDVKKTINKIDNKNFIVTENGKRLKIK